MALPLVEELFLQLPKAQRLILFLLRPIVGFTLQRKLYFSHQVQLSSASTSADPGASVRSGSVLEERSDQILTTDILKGRYME